MGAAPVRGAVDDEVVFFLVLLRAELGRRVVGGEELKLRCKPFKERLEVFFLLKRRGLKCLVEGEKRYYRCVLAATSEFLDYALEA